MHLEDWLIAQANARGVHGAWVIGGPVARDERLTFEDIVVGLCMPHAVADVRVFKLVLRILQTGMVDGPRLARLARMERAEGVLHWLCAGVPAAERNPAFEEIAACFALVPRGWRELRLTYDFGRLLRRPFRLEEASWNRSSAS